MHKSATTFKNKLAAATAARQVNKKTAGNPTYGIKKVKLDSGKFRWVLSLSTDAEKVNA